MEHGGQICTTVVLISLLMTISMSSASGAADTNEVKANATTSAGHPAEGAATTEAAAMTPQTCTCPPPPECPKIDNSHAESLEDHAQHVPHLSKKNFVYVFVSFVAICVAVYLTKGYLARRRQMDRGI